MTDALSYRPSTATKSVWVFNLHVEPDQMEPWVHENFPEDEDAPTIWPLRDALGVDRLDNDFTEVFVARDMQEYGLARYLIESNGFEEESVAMDARRLDALEGPVALIFSEALPDEPLTLSPRPPLEFIGRYDTRPDLRLAAPLDAETAEGILAGPASDAPQARGSLARFLILICVVIAVLMLLWVVL